MSSFNLIMHAGGYVVEREELAKVFMPPATATYQPIPHLTLVEMLLERLPSYGMKVIQEAHGLHGPKGSTPGARYFGLFEMAPVDAATGAVDKAMSLIFGMRNSHDKTFPAGLCLGNGVFVCDNLSFSAEIVMGRRHTTHIMRDLPLCMGKSLGKLMAARRTQEQRFDAYQNEGLNDLQAHDLIIQALRAGAVNTQRVPKVVEQWHTPNHPEFKERNAFSLFNAFTEAYKGANLNSTVALSQTLHAVLDAHCGLLTMAEAKQELIEDLADDDTVVTVR